MDRSGDTSRTTGLYSVTAILERGSISHADTVHTELCVVALPSEYEPIHTIGSDEKHATLLYLGDNVSKDVMELVQASLQGFMKDRSPSPFFERVSSVATLGKNNAQVWMIDSDNGLRMLRERLLMIPAIRALYDTLEQYANYTPHVTVAFPTDGGETLPSVIENAANEVRKIRFDRIALWWGDNHDVVWRMPYPEPEMSEDVAAHGEAYLAQSGVKGMKWGVRKDNNGPSFNRATGDVIHPAKTGSDGVQHPVNKKGERISDDAAKAAAYKTAAKKAGTETLSNAQLQVLVTRMNLEQQYSRLATQSKTQSTGSKFINDILKGIAKQQITKVANDALTNQIGDVMKKSTAA